MYNPQDPFDPLTQLPADSLNQMLDNIDAIHDGTGLVDGGITYAKTDGKIWGEEVGRTTLSSAGDTITVSSLPARKYLHVLAYTYPTAGTINAVVRLNNDSGNNYAARVSDEGSADSASTSISGLFFYSVLAQHNGFLVMDITNVASREKHVIGQFTRTDTGAANAPARREVAGKWANTSDLISRIDIVNTAGTGDFAIGSEIIVLGHN